MASFNNRIIWTNVAAGANPRILSFTLNAGTSRKIIVCAANDGIASSATIDSATYDGQALTSFYSRVTASETRERWFYYDIPDGWTTGAKDIAVTLSADSFGLAITGWITQSDTAGEPLYAVAICADTEASKDVSIAAASGDCLMTTMVGVDGAQTYTATSGQVSLANTSSISGSGARTVKYDAVGDATETVTATWTPSSSSGRKDLTIVNATPAAVGPTITTQPTAQIARINGETVGPIATFTVAATSSGGSLVYDWELEDGVASGVYANVTDGSGATWTGATGTSLVGTFTATTLTGRRVRCNVTDDNGTVTTDAVALTVMAGPVTTASDSVTNGSGVGTLTYHSDDPLATNGELLLWTVTSRGRSFYIVTRPA